MKDACNNHGSASLPEEEPLVSVIIPFLNRIEFVIRAIKSVLIQNYHNFEIVIVNDGSNECDRELVGFFDHIPKITYKKLEHNVGPAEARNIGIEAAKGDFLAFLDSDDIWSKDKLFVQIKTMLCNGWKFSHTSYLCRDIRSGKKKLIKSGVVDYVFPFPAFYCGIATPTVVIKKEALGEIRFQKKMRVGEDTLFWLELSKHMVLHGINNPLATVYVGEETTAFNISHRKAALVVIGRKGLANHRILLAVHFFYRLIRRAQFNLIGFCRRPH